MSYKILLTDGEMATLAWAASRGYFPEKTYSEINMFDKLDCIFVSSGFLFDPKGDGSNEEIEISGSNGIYTFDNKKQNPNKEYPYFVRVGGGYRAFRTRRAANKYYKQD